VTSESRTEKLFRARIRDSWFKEISDFLDCCKLKNVGGVLIHSTSVSFFPGILPVMPVATFEIKLSPLPVCAFSPIQHDFEGAAPGCIEILRHHAHTILRCLPKERCETDEVPSWRHCPKRAAPCARPARLRELFLSAGFYPARIHVGRIKKR